MGMSLLQRYEIVTKVIPQYSGELIDSAVGSVAAIVFVRWSVITPEDLPKSVAFPIG